MKEKIEKLLKDKELTEKILYHYNLHNRTSITFLVHKFRMNVHLAKKIIEIVDADEKEKGISHLLSKKPKKHTPYPTHYLTTYLKEIATHNTRHDG